jgi:hypothetical protein
MPKATDVSITGPDGRSGKARRSVARSRVQFFVVDMPRAGRKGRYFSRFRRRLPISFHRLNTGDEIVDTFLSAERRSVWLAPNDSFVALIAKAVHEPRGDHRLIVFDDRPSRSCDLANVYFRYVVPSIRDVKVLEAEELGEVLAASNREDLFIGGIVDEQKELLVLFRGNLEPLVVPLTWFVGGEASPEPDYRRLSITDYGNTVCLGEFEAATDAILYEFDPEFRRRAKERQRAADPTFGGSMRRLRLQKGLARADFPGVTEKTIARIERNEVESPRPATLRALAKRLGVPVEELGSY